MPSISAGIYYEWELDREKTNAILKSLGGERKLRTVFTNLIGATRSKTSARGQLYITLCPGCKTHLGDWNHHKQCYGFRVPSIAEAGNLTGRKRVIREYMIKIATETPAEYTMSSTLYDLSHAQAQKCNDK